MTYILDTNVWLYALLDRQDAEKSAIAKGLIKGEELLISTQIINEICVNLVRKAHFPEDKIREVITAFYGRYPVLTQEDSATLMTASELREDHSLSYWDSLILSVSLRNEVSILYSEDMQNGLIVREAVKIVNPFEG